MPVPEPEIEIPEIDVLDTPFKKKVAASAAFLVLLGGLLAVAASGASERQQMLSAEANAASIAAFSGYGEANIEISKILGSDAEARSLRQRAALNRVAGSLTGSATYTSAADTWERSSQALEDLAVDATGATHFEDVNQVAIDLLHEPRLNSLLAEAQRDTASDWGATADRYVLGITLLAVSLSLLGLSLTLREGTRKLVVVPAVLIALFAGLVSAGALAQRPSVTPDAAVRALAEGDRQLGLRHFDEAIEAYTRAIKLRGDYTQAYRARASAHIFAGTAENTAYLIATVDRASRLRSIADFAKLLELTPAPDYVSLLSQGANLFHVRRYAESEELTRASLAANDRLPLPWSNLALVQAAQGKEKAAWASYSEMIRRGADRPDPVERAELFSSARTTLEILASQQPRRRGLVRRLEGRLVAAEAELLAPGANPAGADATITGLDLTANGWHLQATYDRAGLPAQSRLAWVGYFRTEPGEAWMQRKELVAIRRLGEAQPGRQTEVIVDVGCSGRGEYRLDAWLDGRLLASATTTASAASTRYVTSYDAPGRAWVCHPPDWDLADDVPGLVRLSAPQPQRTTLSIRTTPLPAELLGKTPQQVDELALARDRSCSGRGRPTEAPRTSVGGVPGVARSYQPSDDDLTAWCWAGVGTDGMLRVVVASYDAANESGELNSLISRVYFEARPPA